MNASNARAQRAVFLSYASQDAEAVRWIAEALRSSGVEVWFDQNELVGGDAWDAKIRRQIKECALFLPVISAATQARLEGYFRIEWKLAAQRTHAIAAAKAFLLPVVLDDTRDAEAHVPEEFLAVQWTRLAPGESLDRFCARVQKLLVGEITSPTAVRPAAGAVLAAGPHRSHGAWIAGAAALGVVLVLGVWQPWKKTTAPDLPTGQLPQKLGAETAATLAAKAFENYYPFSTPGRLQLADEFSRRATELDPLYARGWGTRAAASARYLLRDWVSGEAARQRARDAQSFANRALSLDKGDTEALIALGIVMWHQHANEQAEKFYRQVMAIDPTNVQAPALLSRVARESGRVAEAVALMKGAVKVAPRDPHVRLYAGFAYFDGWNYRKAAEEFAAADFPGALVYKAWAQFYLTGDLARLRADLDRQDLVYSEDDGKLAMNLACAVFERRTDRVVELAGRTASTYIDDWWTPKAWFVALAYERDQKGNLARQQWQAAEAAVRERLRSDAQDEILRVNLAITLAKLGRAAEARPDLEAVEAVWREQTTPIRARRLARFYASTGDAARAVAWLRQCVNRPTFLDENETPRTLELDPWWDGIRNSGEFRALLANPPPPPPPVDEPLVDNAAAQAATSGVKSTAAVDKSVAVLAFSNLSSDKEQEYFSDGISEELLNVLAKVPGLKVSARTSAFYFKGKSTPIPEIAKQLGVAYVVEGSVRKAGEKVRITAQLIKAADGFHVWSDTFTRDLKDVFVVQDEIAGLVAKNLQLQMGVGTFAGGAPAKDSTQVLPLYYAALQAWNLRTIEGLARAEELLNQVLALDPAFARGHAGLAAVWLIRGEILDTISPFGLRQGELAVKIGAKLAEALRLDPHCAEAYGIRGAYNWDTWQREQGLADLRRATELNPNFASAHQWMGRIFATQGRLDEAVAALKRAAELDPLSQRILDNYGRVLIWARRANEALALADRALALQPNAMQAMGVKASALLLLGREAEALEIARTLPADQPIVSIYKVIVLAAAGQTSELEVMLGRFGPGGHVSQIAALTALGRKAEALASFDPSWITATRADMLLFEPIFDPLRREPRFLAALQQLGLSTEHDHARAWLLGHPAGKPQPKK